MLISVRHITRYRYAEPVSYTIQILRLTPLSFMGQRVLDWQVRAGGISPRLQFRDGFGNTAHLLTVNGRHEELVIEAGGTVETQDCNGVVSGLNNSAPPRVFLRETAQTKPDGAIRALAESVHGKDTLDQLHALLGAVRERVEYVAGATDMHTSAAEALADGKGVCQDHAHIFIAACRRLGVPARYVSGYLRNDDPELHVGRTSHSWAEAWVPGLDWVGFDPANGISPRGDSLRVAVGLDYRDAAPVSGRRVGFGDAKMSVEASVRLME